MSQTNPPADPNARPWHTSDNPWEAMFQWAKTELAAAHKRIDDLVTMIRTPAPSAPMVAAQNTAADATAGQEEAKGDAQTKPGSKD